MIALYRTEFRKLFRRREFWIIAVALSLSIILPLALSLAPDSYAITYAFGSSVPQVAYHVIGYAFWEAMGIFVVLFAILTIGLTSTEIESHYFYLYFPRVNNRSRVFRSKLMLLLAFATVWYLLYTVVLNSVGYAIFSYVRPDMAGGFFSDGSHGYWLCMWVLYYFELVFYIFLSVLLGFKMKPLTAVVTVLLVFYGCMLLFDLPLVRYIVPEYYKQCAIKADSLSTLSTTYLYTALYCGIVIALSGLMYTLGKKRIAEIEA
ncbi:MAG: hypothetical protein J1E60_01090 [Christensenellaceae bacterium]|nr:hypothetical protein [Christensenellaceae bacterium]